MMIGTSWGVSNVERRKWFGYFMILNVTQGTKELELAFADWSCRGSVRLSGEVALKACERFSLTPKRIHAIHSSHHLAIATNRSIKLVRSIRYDSVNAIDNILDPRYKNMRLRSAVAKANRGQ